MNNSNPNLPDYISPTEQVPTDPKPYPTPQSRGAQPWTATEVEPDRVGIVGLTAKMRVTDVSRQGGSEVVKLSAVHGGETNDTDNTFSSNGSPTAFMEIVVDHPDAQGAYAVDDIVTVEVTGVERAGGYLDDARYYTRENFQRSRLFWGPENDEERETVKVYKTRHNVADDKKTAQELKDRHVAEANAANEAHAKANEGTILEPGTRYYTSPQGVRSSNFTGDVSEFERENYVDKGWALSTVEASAPIGHNSPTSPTAAFNS